MKHILLEKYLSINYALAALIDQNGKVFEFVAAYAYDERTKTWGQGHYFEELNGAVKYINGILEEHNKEILEE